MPADAGHTINPLTALSALHAHPPLRSARSALAALAAAVLALSLAACGSGASSGTKADPATVVPARAPLFAAAVVRPTGSLSDAAKKAGKALTHRADPYLALVSLLQTPGSPALDYKRDVAPWLGPQAGAFVTSLRAAAPLVAILQQGLLGAGARPIPFPFASGGAQGALVLDTSDAAKARAFLSRQAQRAGAHTTSFDGVAYQVDGAGVAFGLVRRFVVIGSESALHAVVEAAAGGSSLARTSGYSKLLAQAPSGVLAHVYSNPTEQPAGAAGLISLLTGPRQANVSLVPSTNSLALDVDALPSGTQAGLLTPSGEGARALSRLPGESWLAIGLPKPGKSLAGNVAALRALGALLVPSEQAPTAPGGVLEVGSLLGALTKPLDALAAGVGDAQAWMGPVGIFATGTGLLEIRGAVVIDSTRPALSRAAVSQLAAKLGGATRKLSIPGTDAAEGVRLNGLPLEMVIADGRSSSGQTELVLGLGEPSIGAALSPSSTLESSASHSAASSTLGLQPSLIFEVPTLLGLLESLNLTESPSIAPVVPYLRSMTTLSGGGEDLPGGAQRFRLVLGLRPAS